MRCVEQNLGNGGFARKENRGVGNPGADERVGMNEPLRRCGIFGRMLGVVVTRHLGTWKVGMDRVILRRMCSVTGLEPGPFGNEAKVVEAVKATSRHKNKHSSFNDQSISHILSKPHRVPHLIPCTCP